MTVDPKYFHAPESSNGRLKATVNGETMAIRVWWDADDNGEPVIFQRLGVYAKDYLYVAIDWDRRTIITTACASTDKAARRAILDDLNRRGWTFTNK
jgi:hypothetical protein